MRHVLVAVATAAVFVLGGCGSDDATNRTQQASPRAAANAPRNGDLLFARGDYTRGNDERWRVLAAHGGGGRITRVSSLVFPTLPLPSPDGRLVAFSRPTWEDGPARRVYVASLRRKSLRPLTNGRRLDWPVQWSPEGRRLLVGHAAGVGHDNVSLVDVNGRTRRLVRVEGTAADGATWAPDGRRVLARLDVFGPRGLHLVNVRTWTSRRVTAEDEQPSWGAFTPTGRLAFITTRSGPVTQDLWLADEDGTNRELVLSLQTRGHIWGIQWSRDGSRLAVSVLFGDDDTSRLVVLPATARKVEITETSGVAGRHAIWSPDGRRLAFVRGRFPTDDVWVMTADGGVERRLTRTRLGERPLAWLPARQR